MGVLIRFEQNIMYMAMNKHEKVNVWWIYIRTKNKFWYSDIGYTSAIVFTLNVAGNTYKLFRKVKNMHTCATLSSYSHSGTHVYS